MTASYRKIRINEKHFQDAAKIIENAPIYKNSHRKENANQVGFLGEIVFEDFLETAGIEFSKDKKTTHDYSIRDDIKVELKTKDRTVMPKLNFDNSVPLYNHVHQQPDFYYFISLERQKSQISNDIRRFKYAYILGGTDRKTLHEKGIIWKEGDVDPSNGTKFWTSCINIGMKDLTENKEMIKKFRRI